ncbi:sensor histidine kinase [Falsiroseomonas sp. CW058]|uniref:sensor histidine kinase n=1 Tax=Falsiroseomonas sp. CW058 TaxID=3388664 RepID=UPI003D311EA2
MSADRSLAALAALALLLVTAGVAGGLPMLNGLLLGLAAAFALGAGWRAITRAARPGDARRGADPFQRLASEVASVVVQTPDGVIRHWSPGAERLFGFTSAEAVGQRMQELLRTRFAHGGRRAALAELTRGGEWQGELRHRRRDGRVVTVATTWLLRPSPEGGEPLVVEACTEAAGLSEAQEALQAYEGRLRLAQEVAGVGTWEWDTAGEVQDWSREQHALFGTDADAVRAPTVENLLALVHPDDRPALRAAIARGLDTGEYEAEFRIGRRGRDGQDETRWLIGRGRRMPGRAGRPGPMLGVHVDITVRKEAEQRQALLIREVDHRAKNALAVVQAVLRLTRAPDQAAYVRAVEGRVATLARAQTLLTQSGWSGADLRGLLEGELAPFLTTGSLGPTVDLNGPPAMLAPLVAQPLAMAMHELATNAVKHGALGVPGGRVAVDWRLDTEGGRRLLRLSWAESGGPALGAPPERVGFGSRVLKATIGEQLGGRIAQDWQPGGIVCRIEIPLPEAGGPERPSAEGMA